MPVRKTTKHHLLASIADPHHVDAEPDPDPSFQIKAQNLEKVLEYKHIPFNLACHLQPASLLCG
jgi:hypothetical protein